MNSINRLVTQSSDRFPNPRTHLVVLLPRAAGAIALVMLMTMAPPQTEAAAPVRSDESRPRPPHVLSWWHVVDWGWMHSATAIDRKKPHPIRCIRCIHCILGFGHTTTTHARTRQPQRRHGRACQRQPHHGARRRPWPLPSPPPTITTMALPGPWPSLAALARCRRHPLTNVSIDAVPRPRVVIRRPDSIDPRPTQLPNSSTTCENIEKAVE